MNKHVNRLLDGIAMLGFLVLATSITIGITNLVMLYPWYTLGIPAGLAVVYGFGFLNEVREHALQERERDI